MKRNGDELLLDLINTLDDDMFKRTFETVTCFNIVNLVYELTEEDKNNESMDRDEEETIKKYMNKIGYLCNTSQSILSATVSMIKSFYADKYHDKLMNMIVNVAPHKSALISTAYKADENDPRLYMNRSSDIPSAVGAMIYSKEELDRLSIIYDRMKIFIKDPDNCISIPKEDTVTTDTFNGYIKDAIDKYKDVKNFIIKETDLMKMFKLAIDNNDMSDLDDFIALICALYVDNFIYMISTLPNLKENLGNIEKNPYASSLTLLEVEDPVFKDNYKDLYNILIKYKLLTLRLTSTLNQVMEQMFATIVHAFIMNMLYEYESNSPKLCLNLNLDKIDYYSCCQLIKIQMGFESLLKEDIAYNIGSLPEEVIDRVYQNNNKNKDKAAKLSAKLKSTGTTLDQEPPKYYN